MARFKWVFTALCAGLIVTACGRSPEPAVVEVRLMETTDLHAYLLGYDYFNQQSTTEYGLAHTAVLIEQARSENPNNLLFDNGDLIQGSAMGDWAANEGLGLFETQLHPAITALNYLQYDAANLGNHEFNFGLDFLEHTLAGANFPFVSANAYYADQPEQAGMKTEGWHNPIVPPYVILEREMLDQEGQRHLIKVGVIGFLPPQIMVWDASHLAGKVYVRDMVAAAQYYVPKMREAGADIVVAIPHSGMSSYDRYSEFSEQATRSIATVPGIDAIMFGHQHRIFPGDESYNNLPHVDNQRGLVHGVPAVQPGYWGNRLGVIDLELEQHPTGWHVRNSRVELREVTEQADSALEQLLADQQAATLAMLNEPLANLTNPINSFFARVVPDRSTAFINNAQTWYGQQLQAQELIPSSLPLLSAAAPFRQGFQNASDYTHIQAGEITLGDLASLYVYPNTLQVMKIDGSTLRAWLEMSALAFLTIDPEQTAPQPIMSNYPSFNFDVISGVQYRIDPTQPPRYNSAGELLNDDAQRITHLSYNGEPVLDSQEFLIMVNNYRAGGGGNFPGVEQAKVVYQSGEEVRQVIAQYARAQIQASGSLAVSNVADWSLELPPNVRLQLKSADSDAAKTEAELFLQLQASDEVLNGYRTYFYQAL